MSELVQQPPAWAQSMQYVGTLAENVAGTEFVPDPFRGKVAHVAAAMMTGDALGIHPMTAIAHLHVIKGKVGMSAQLMRQLILQAGHELHYEKTTDTICIVRGRRKGQDTWTEASFSAEQAKLAQINLGQYPEDKLVARATSRLARRAFADCLGGVPYLAEELEEPAESAPVTVSRGKATKRQLDGISRVYGQLGIDDEEARERATVALAETSGPLSKDQAEVAQRRLTAIAATERPIEVLEQVLAEPERVAEIVAESDEVPF